MESPPALARERGGSYKVPLWRNAPNPFWETNKLWCLLEVPVLHAWSMGDKGEELEMRALLQGCDPVGVAGVLQRSDPGSFRKARMGR